MEEQLSCLLYEFIFLQYRGSGKSLSEKELVIFKELVFGC